MSNLAYPESQVFVTVFILIIKKSINYMEHDHHKTLGPLDVVHVLKNMGCPMYGFGGYEQ